MTQLIKIVRTLYKYFLPRSKKMCLSSKVKNLRDKLLENCKYAIDRLEVSESKVAYASSSQENTITGSSDTKSEKEPESDAFFEITDSKIMSGIMELTHGVLIQEWEHFLNDIFVEGVIYYLRGYDLGDPKYKISLKILKPTIEDTEKCNNISAEVKNLRWGYDNLFKQSRNLFKVEEPELLDKMNKHLWVRHIFQHYRGEIRSTDLEAIGRLGGHFDILDEEGMLVPYKEGYTIKLSKPEIQDVYDTIEKYSKEFQEQAEKAKPVEAG